MEKTEKRLPADVTVDLLSRLPVKSVYRFRCVCKEWLALISYSGPGSVKDLHNKRLRKVPYLIKWNMPLTYLCPIRAEEVGLKKKKEIKGDHVTLLPYVTRVSTLEVKRLHKKLVDIAGDVDMASCHGLICFISACSNVFHICNPSTNELVKIPESPNDSRKGNFYYGSSTSFIGFGYLPFTDQYKIVRFYEDDSVYDYQYNGRVMGCEIFILTDGKDTSRCSWKAIGKERCPRFYRESVCVKGVIYWLLRDRSMMAFDLEREEHEIIPLPEGLVDGFRTLIDFGGSLCLARSLRGKVSVWALTDPKNPEWVPEYTLSFIPRSVEEIVYSSTTDEDVEIAVSSWNEMWWYDSKRRTLTWCSRKPGKSKIEKEDYPCAYVESLFSLGSGGA